MIGTAVASASQWLRRMLLIASFGTLGNPQTAPIAHSTQSSAALEDAVQLRAESARATLIPLYNRIIKNKDVFPGGVDDLQWALQTVSEEVAQIYLSQSWRTFDKGSAGSVFGAYAMQNYREYEKTGDLVFFRRFVAAVRLNVEISFSQESSIVHLETAAVYFLRFLQK